MATMESIPEESPGKTEVPGSQRDNSPVKPAVTEEMNTVTVPLETTFEDTIGIEPMKSTTEIIDTQPLSFEDPIGSPLPMINPWEILGTQPFELFDPTMYMTNQAEQGLEEEKPEEDDEDDLWNPPIIHPVNPRHEAFIFCYAKEFEKHFPDIAVCAGCQYSSCSQLDHKICTTERTASKLREEEVAVDKTSITLTFNALLVKLDLDATTKEEVDILTKKAENEWKSLIVRAIVYGFEGFPDEW